MAFTKTKSGLLIPTDATRHRPNRVRAKYDAATVNDDNKKYWENIDGLSADALQSPQTRQKLRNFSRYEVANNSYAKGMVLTLANDLVGTGPRLQMQMPNDKETNKRIAKEFEYWAEEVRLAQILRTMRQAKIVDGETFLVIQKSPNMESPVKMGLKLIEAEMVRAKLDVTGNDLEGDGITYDDFGNPLTYNILKNHPGGLTNSKFFNDSYTVPARSVIHWYRADRPIQKRAIPEITPSLPLFAQLRRYTLAVIAAAETAADFAAVLQMQAPADGSATVADPFDVVELEKRMLTVLPEGGTLGQIKAEQPVTTYSEFKREILSEIARCQNVPINIVLGDSSKHNYASGRLDHQVYYKSIRIEQDDMAIVVLDKILKAWLNMAILISDLMPVSWRTIRYYPHQWFWDGNEHVDPQKEANAADTRLKNKSLTYARYYAAQGLDWEDEFEQAAIENEKMESLGIKPADVAQNQPANKEDEE